MKMYVTPLLPRVEIWGSSHARTRRAQKCESEKEGAREAGNITETGWMRLLEKRASGSSGGCVVAASPTEYFWNRWIRHPGQTSLLGCLDAIPEYVVSDGQMEKHERETERKREGGEVEEEEGRFLREEIGRRYATMQSLYAQDRMSTRDRIDYRLKSIKSHYLRACS